MAGPHVICPNRCEALLDRGADPNILVDGLTVLDRCDLSASRATQALIESRGGRRTRAPRVNPGRRGASRGPRGPSYY